jgi:hypothetical protein
LSFHLSVYLFFVTGYIAEHNISAEKELGSESQTDHCGSKLQAGPFLADVPGQVSYCLSLSVHIFKVRTTLQHVCHL